jgi:hypothetical protein
MNFLTKPNSPMSFKMVWPQLQKAQASLGDINCRPAMMPAEDKLYKDTMRIGGHVSSNGHLESL